MGRQHGAGGGGFRESSAFGSREWAVQDTEKSPEWENHRACEVRLPMASTELAHMVGTHPRLAPKMAPLLRQTSWHSCSVGILSSCISLGSVTRFGPTEYGESDCVWSGWDIRRFMASTGGSWNARIILKLPFYEEARANHMERTQENKDAQLAQLRHQTLE